jgi:hypothetical protein
MRNRELVFVTGPRVQAPRGAVWAANAFLWLLRRFVRSPR